MGYAGKEWAMSYKDDIQKKYDYGDFALKPKFEDAVLRLEFSNICNDHYLGRYMRFGTYLMLEVPRYPL